MGRRNWYSIACGTVIAVAFPAGMAAQWWAGWLGMFGGWHALALGVFVVCASALFVFQAWRGWIAPGWRGDPIPGLPGGACQHALWHVARDVPSIDLRDGVPAECHGCGQWAVIVPEVEIERGAVVRVSYGDQKSFLIASRGSDGVTGQ